MWAQPWSAAVQWSLRPTRRVMVLWLLCVPFTPRDAIQEGLEDNNKQLVNDNEKLRHLLQTLQSQLQGLRGQSAELIAGNEGLSALNGAPLEPSSHGHRASGATQALTAATEAADTADGTDTLNTAASDAQIEGAAVAPGPSTAADAASEDEAAAVATSAPAPEPAPAPSPEVAASERVSELASEPEATAMA